jgi:Flavodoxin
MRLGCTGALAGVGVSQEPACRPWRVVAAGCKLLARCLPSQAVSTSSQCMRFSLLQGVTYGVFGLGNKQYEHFAAVGKRMHKALGALGATPLCDRGDGDDDDDIDADFDAWQAALLEGLDASPLVAVPKVGT